MAAKPGATPTVLLRYSEDGAAEAEAALAASSDDGVAVLTASQLVRAGTGAVAQLRGCRHLAVVGDPPAAGIAYCLAPLVAAVARPERVTLMDAGRGAAVSSSLSRYLAASLVPALAQLGVSGSVLPAQRQLARTLLSSPPAPAARGELRRVLYLRPLVGVPSAVGGSITHSHGVIRALGQLGLEVDPLTNDRSIRDTAAADPDPPCEWRLATVPRPLRALPASLGLGADLALASLARPTVRRAQAIYQRHARFSLAGALLGRLTGRPLFLEYNGSEAFFEASYDRTPLAGQLLLCEDASLAAAARVLVTSDVDRDNLLERGIPAERIVLNPNGVEPERFARGDGPSVRRALGLRDDAVLVGFVGSFGPWHGTPTLARAFARMAASRPDVHLLMVGEGPDHPAVEELLADAGLLGQRAHLVGRVAPSAVPAHLDACDVLVSPHIPFPGDVPFFGSPTKLFEYMAAERGIVASRLGQIGEVLDDGQTALLVTPGDVDELVRGMERLVDDPELRSELAKRARSRAIDRHSWRANAARVVEAYAELQSSTAARATPS